MYKPIQLTKRKCIIASSFALSILLVIGTVIAQSSLPTITISGGPYPGAPDYTIFTEASMFYAKNRYGTIISSSTNSTAILHSTCALAANGETVYVENGNYSCYGLSLNDYTTLTLQKNATLRLPDNSAVTPTTSNVIFITRDAYNITINGEGTIDGNYPNNLGASAGAVAHCGYGVYIRSQAQNIRIEGISVVNCRSYGITIRANPGKVSYNNWIENAVIMNNGFNDVTFEPYDHTSQLYSSGVRHCITGGVTGDISLSVFSTTLNASSTVAVAWDIVFEGNTIKPMSGLLGSANPAGWYGVKFERQCVRCVARNNIMEGVCVGVADDNINPGLGQHTITGNIIRMKDCNASKGYPNYAIELRQNFSTAALNTISGSGLAQDWQGVRVQENVSYCTVTQNKIVDEGGSGSSIGLREYGAGGTKNIWALNTIKGCDTNATLSGVTFYVEGNINYP